MSQADTLWLKVSVPIASFTVPQAREFLESYPFPPPTTVYGMLLSFIGETDPNAFKGTGLAILVEGLPASSVVLRKMRRFKDRKMASDKNSKPDFQEVLTGLVFYAGIQSSGQGEQRSLAQELSNALQNPEAIQRFGGLSCGESHNLIDQIHIVQHPLAAQQKTDITIWGLLPSEEGDWSVAVWADHVNLSNTSWAQAEFVPIEETVPEQYFFTIGA